MNGFTVILTGFVVVLLILIGISYERSSVYNETREAKGGIAIKDKSMKTFCIKKESIIKVN